VAVGRRQAEVLVAVFPLAGGGAACLQLQDEGALRRGGVYLLARDDPAEPGIAPRIDELVRALRHAAAAPRRAAVWRRLLPRAAAAARATRPRLGPGALRRVRAVLRAAQALERRAPPPPGGLGAEALLAACLLLFVSEEERYPAPRYRGGELLLERLLDALPAAPDPAGG
jgi:hypothetical protein